MYPWLICIFLLLAGAHAQPPQSTPSPANQDGLATFKTSTNLVLVHLTVKDRGGKAIEQLSKNDVTVLEDGRPQEIALFEFQRLNAETLPATSSSTQQFSPLAPSRNEPTETTFRDRRLLVLFFDLSSLDLGQQVRAVDAGLKFLRTQMSRSDTVAVYAYSSELRLVSDFSSDRDRLLKAVQQLKTGVANFSYQDRFTGAGDDDFRLFNVERKLNTLEELTRNLGKLPEKKALIYISNGGKRTGIENLAQLRATTMAANRANVSFYTVDARGLDATAPLGGADAPSGKGADVFSGQGAAKLRFAAMTQQDAMSALAADTGGKMIHDTNDLTLGMQSAQQDMSSYYIVGYYSTNSEADGKFRKVTIQMKHVQSARLEYRPGYFAPKIFKLLDGRERERQLEETILLDYPVTDIPVAVGAIYFRLEPSKYFVSLSARIPGSAIPLADAAGRQETDFDVLGVVLDQHGKAMGRISDKVHVKLTADMTRELGTRGLQYDTGFSLPPGVYTLKFVVREDREGKMGTFETPLAIPDLTQSAGLRLSSVVWSGQRENLEAAGGRSSDGRRDKGSGGQNPLIRGSFKLVPNLTSLYNTAQTLIVYCEAYDVGAHSNLSASIALYQGDKPVFLSAALKAEQQATGRTEAVPLQLELPLSRFKPGEYIAQLNVIDQAGKKVAFLRKPLTIVAISERGKPVR